MLTQEFYKQPLGARLSSLLSGTSRGFLTEPARRRADCDVDLQRFVGDWYVVASIPTSLERDAFNAIESYEPASDGFVKSMLRYRKADFDGEPQEYRSRVSIHDTAPGAAAVLRFPWPTKPNDHVVHVSDDYSQAVVGRNGGDFVRILARTPSISNEDFFELAQKIRRRGYDTSKLKLVPQRWDSGVASRS